MVIDRICDTAPVLLRPGAVLLMVHSGMCGPETTEGLRPALYLLYELHYPGFDSVADERARDPDLLRLCRALETRFLHTLRSEPTDAPHTAADAFAPPFVEPMDRDGRHRVRRVRRRLRRAHPRSCSPT